MHQTGAHVSVAAMTMNSEAKADRSNQEQRLSESFDVHLLTIRWREMVIKTCSWLQPRPTAPADPSN